MENWYKSFRGFHTYDSMISFNPAVYTYKHTSSYFLSEPFGWIIFLYTNIFEQVIMRVVQDIWEILKDTFYVARYS